MSLRCRDIFIVGVGLAIVAGCKREERDFEPDAPAAQASATVTTTELVPGLPPSVSPSAADVQPNRSDFEKVAFQLSEGQRLYEQMNCVGCHGNGGGDIGPPLMDDVWIYGSNPEQIYASLVQGRPNGMPAYGRKLSQQQTWQLVAFVRSMSGLSPKTAAPARNDRTQSVPPPNSTPATNPVSGPNPSPTAEHGSK